MRKARFYIIFLICISPIVVNGQNQTELPVLAIRHLNSWGPNFESFNPEIAIYKNGFVIFKTIIDSFHSPVRYNYYCSQIKPEKIDSFLTSTHLENEFESLQNRYDPCSAENPVFDVSDAGSILVSVHGRINKTISIYNRWAFNDTAFVFNPKPAKLIYDWLGYLKDSILSGKHYKSWTPSKIELVREICTRDQYLDESCSQCHKTNLGKKFQNQQWVKFSDRISKDYQTHLKFEILPINSAKEIRSLIKQLNKPYRQTALFNGKLYQVFYTFGYDIIPYYHDYQKQHSTM